MLDWVNSVEFILMPSRHPVKGFEKQYHEAYQVWRSAWEKFYQDLKIDQPLNSDPYCVTDEVGAIFYQNECVAIVCFTHGNLGPKDTMKDAQWFRSWTPEALLKLKNISLDCIICSQFTVSPKFTGKDQVTRWKDVLALYACLRFENSDSGVMAGHLNGTKSMEKTCGEDNGATVLEYNHALHLHGVPLHSQLVAYEREGLKKLWQAKNLHSQCDDLWSRLVHLSEFRAHQKILDFKKMAA
jgi:hypothetical protein